MTVEIVPGLTRAGSVFPGGTVGSVLFIDTGPIVSQDNADLFWDNSLKRFGIGNASPQAPLHLKSSGGNNTGLLVETTGTGNTGYASINYLSPTGSSGFQTGLYGSTATNADYAFFFNNTTNGGIIFAVQSVQRMRIHSNGNIGIGSSIVTPTSQLHLGGGIATANFSPIKFTVGTNLTSPESGAMEYNNALYFTNWKGIRYSIGGILFDHFADAGNTTTTETDLYSDTLLANTFATNGDKVTAMYGGIFVSSGTATREIRVYFGETVIFDTGALSISAGADAWTINVVVIRDSSSSVRCSVYANLTGAALNAFCAYTSVSGLTLTNTQVLKITGQAAGVGAATNDIVAKLGTVEWKPAA
jgi:hypothetical protein